MQAAPAWILLVALGLAVSGCVEGTGLTLYNGTAGPIGIEGLPEGPLQIPASQEHRSTDLKNALKLKATNAQGQVLELLDLSLPPAGGEALWILGGGACFIEADFSAYYGQLEGAPPAAVVIDRIGPDPGHWASKGPVASGPGERLPSSGRGGSVHALVRVPCEATQSEDIARGWLEMILPELQPN